MIQLRSELTGLCSRSLKSWVESCCLSWAKEQHCSVHWKKGFGNAAPRGFSCAEMGLSCLSWNYTKAQKILIFAFSFIRKYTYFKGTQCAVQSQLKRWNLGSVVLIYSQSTLRHPEVIYSKLLSVLFALHLPWAEGRTASSLFFSCHCVVSVFHWWK